MRCWNRTDQESCYLRYTDWGYTKIWRYKTSKTGCLQRGNSEYVVQWFGTASVTNWADGCWPENLVSVEFLAIQGVRSSYSCIKEFLISRHNWYTLPSLKAASLKLLTFRWNLAVEQKVFARGELCDRGAVFKHPCSPCIRVVPTQLYCVIPVNCEPARICHNDKLDFSSNIYIAIYHNIQ